MSGLLFTITSTFSFFSLIVALFHDQAEEAQNDIPRKAATGIKRAFREVTTFCLPYPGKRIANASEADQERMQVCGKCCKNTMPFKLYCLVLLDTHSD